MGAGWAMSVLGIFAFPVGTFLVLIGLVSMVDAPFPRGLLDSSSYLRKNRRLVGAALAVIGFVLMALG